ncbi:basic amino acid/polyamine antiporter [Parafannyhessea umbonata]|uniref:basic amino acid/polyamine antiporter n=1 Tax=Parafannyhessea umbonata TaxID=604330 RepID=UPI0026F36CB8|nr:basic amino acid/polyamine antiporter [Parafannyhessea umbonata]MCI6682540.1 basic amino acid/polyamine antiporter [Parafannyhessea umbonata]MCI7218312.1 basic amino acid/polyamine antiporter [Parafannyhessea umbonata]MDY4014489.1 basic amino acid/polyamine antiporter [Parafannyhessea umbonata]
MADSAAAASQREGGIGFFGLVGLVVSSCIGTGVFALTGQLAQVASPGGVLVSWLVVGVGFLMLALSLNNLVVKKPKLSSIYAYAQDGFGPFAGFVSGWGYWLSAWLGNVAFATILASTIGFFFPYFLPGNNIGSILLGSLVNWVLVVLVIRGVESASFLNALIMVVKVAALAVFVLFCGVSFKAGVFTADFWGNVHDAAVAAGTAGKGAAPLGDVATQIKNCLITMMWVFIGVEGASVVTSRARRRSEAGTATVVGLLIVVAVYLGASLLPYGVMPYQKVAKLSYPAMLYVFEKVAPGWGGAFIAIAMPASGFGCWLSFTLLPAEVTQRMSEDHLLGSWWGRLNGHGAPRNSLVVVGVCTQLFMASLLFTQDAYNFALSMCTVSIAITWALAAAFQAKLSLERHEAGQAVIGLVATVFLVVGTVLSGWQYLLMCCLGYIPGLFFFVAGRREAGKSVFARQDVTVAIIIVAAAIAAVVLLALGVMSF